jgi:hypothetical protein
MAYSPERRDDGQGGVMASTTVYGGVPGRRAVADGGSRGPTPSRGGDEG